MRQDRYAKLLPLYTSCHTQLEELWCMNSSGSIEGWDMCTIHCYVYILWCPWTADTGQSGAAQTEPYHYRSYSVFGSRLSSRRDSSCRHSEAPHLQIQGHWLLHDETGTTEPTESLPFWSALWSLTHWPVELLVSVSSSTIRIQHQMETFTFISVSSSQFTWPLAYEWF